MPEQGRESPPRSTSRDRLPPLSSQSPASGSEWTRRLTPGKPAAKRPTPIKFDLPQLASAARQCFSFEDTTVDDEEYLAAPDHAQTFYGLSAVASHDEEDLRRASSFDPWSPPSSGRLSSWGSRRRRVWSLDNGQRGQTFQADGFSGSASRRDGKEKDWKRIEAERGDAIDLLACMVEQLSRFDPADSEAPRDKYEQIGDDDLGSRHGGTRGDRLERMKLVAASIKEICADPSREPLAAFDRETRAGAIDSLLRSYEFALRMRQSSLSAGKWLESIGLGKNFAAGDEGDECDRSPDSVALMARLRLAESAILGKQRRIGRLNEELSSCRAEIGRLRSRERPQHQPMLTSTNNESMLSSSSSSDGSAENSAERSGSLVLCSPPPAAKSGGSHDESFARWEKGIELQMNLDARKEILLLKAALERANRRVSALERQRGAQEKEPFPSEIEPIKKSSEDDHPEELFMRIAQDIESEALDTTGDTTVLVEGDDDEAGGDPCDVAPIGLDDPALERELEGYREALTESLRAGDGWARGARADSMTSSEELSPARDLEKSDSSELASDQKMVNVRMIDGENFSTEWGDLAPALPPPPDHELHSPIVHAILSKWTDDPGTRSALIDWIEGILKGTSNADATPSLKLCGLDHTIRDGFVMHVLPLLLRRKDIRIHVTSRAHRQTTYDIAVSVWRSASACRDRASDAEGPGPQQGQAPAESRRHMMAFQATRSGASIKENSDAWESPVKQPRSSTKPFLGHLIPTIAGSSSTTGSISTAITSPISNRTPSRYGRPRYTSLASEMKNGDPSVAHDKFTSPSLGDDLSVGSSGDDDADSKHSQRSSLMGSISGAFSLLSRRKPPPVENGFHGYGVSRGHPATFQTPKREAARSARKSSDDKGDGDQPYHRVVSAPPGKIGITFVEYRGHAMVSNVLEESPLVGWVHPSDVLVAIDDVPVSGLRTRDIVRLLTNKAGQQRNLRMVSSVAMNEIARPGTV